MQNDDDSYLNEHKKDWFEYNLWSFSRVEPDLIFLWLATFASSANNVYVF